MKGPVQGFWGKLELCDGSVGAWHPLADHCADVAACCEALVRETLLGSRLATLAEQKSLSTVQISRLGVLAALHDVGKFNIGFQNKALERPPFKCGHLAEVLVLLDTSKGYALTPRLHHAICADSLDAWGDCVLELLTATISHHGRPIGLHGQIDPAWWSPARGLDPFAGIAALVEQTRSWFPDAWSDAADPLPESSAFQHAWSGLVMLADWIGSDADRFFPFSENGDEDRMPFARRAASEALQRLGLAAGCARRSLGTERPGFERIAPALRPRPAQSALLELSPEAGPGTVAILEAETGAGKTEAALAYFVRLLHAGLVDGLYFAPPPAASAALQRVGSSASSRSSESGTVRWRRRVSIRSQKD